MTQMSPEMTSGQQSSVSSTRKGIHALETARDSITRSKTDVEDTAHALSGTYTGDDGYTYGDLLRDWDKQCEIILKNLNDMIDKLNTSLTEHTKTQSAASDAINHARTQSQSVFETLTTGSN